MHHRRLFLVRELHVLRDICLTTHHYTSTQSTLALQRGSSSRSRSAYIARAEGRTDFPISCAQTLQQRRDFRTFVARAVATIALLHAWAYALLHNFEHIENEGSLRCLSLLAPLFAMLPYSKWCSQNDSPSLCCPSKRLTTLKIGQGSNRNRPEPAD